MATRNVRGPRSPQARVSEETRGHRVESFAAVAQRHLTMTSQGTPHGRWQRVIHARNVQAAELAAREMGLVSPGR